MHSYRQSSLQLLEIPESWWELVPFIGAGLLALVFTAVLVLLVEDAEPQPAALLASAPITVTVISATQSTTASSSTTSTTTVEGRLPRFIGLAEKGHLDESEEIGLTLGRKASFNIMRWISLGLQSLAHSSAPSPSLSSKPSQSSSRPTSRKSKSVPTPLNKLPVVRSATVFPRNLLVYPAAPASPEPELECPTTPTTPTSPPVTPLTPMSPPPTPVLSMARLIMHRHDQAVRKARRARQYAQHQQQQHQQHQVSVR